MGNCLTMGQGGQVCSNSILSDKIYIIAKENLSVAAKSDLTLAKITEWVEDGDAIIIKADHVVPAEDAIVTEKTTYSEAVTGYTAGKNLFSINHPTDRVVNNAITGSYDEGDFFMFIVSANNIFSGRRSATDGKVFEMSPVHIIKQSKVRGSDTVANKITFEFSFTDVWGENHLSSTYKPSDISIADLTKLQLTDITFVNMSSSIANSIKVVAYDFDEKTIVSEGITTTNIVVKDGAGATVTGTWTLAGDVLVFSATVTAQTYTISGNFVTDRFNLPEPISIVIAS